MTRRVLEAWILVGGILVAGMLPARGDDSRVRTDPRHGAFRSIDGSGNNPRDPQMGAAGTTLARELEPAYGDGVWTMGGVDRPGARAISNAVCSQEQPVLNAAGASDYLWQWGQFVDHDIDLTGAADPSEPAHVPIPTGDPFFDPDGTGSELMIFERSLWDPSTGIADGNPRQQINQITAWLDGSNVYGSDPVRAAALRTLDGTGRLRTSPGDLLPFNTAGLPNAGGPGPDLFLAGDVRANEQVGLTSLHTLFVREHNYHARRIAAAEHHLSGDRIYERARRLVGAEIQAITYNEFLPVLLGPRALDRYRDYQWRVDARITNLFSTAAYRFGHSAVGTELLRLDRSGQPVPEGNLALRDAFFAPWRISEEGGIEPILRGLAAHRCQEIDVLVVDDLRNFLFGDPGDGGFDLAALNIQRGRDHGLPSYNDARVGLGLPPALGFADVNPDPEVQARLASIYTTVEDIDAWVGGLAEPPVPGAMVGELVFTVLVTQFEALRDGDRYWYEQTLEGRTLQEVRKTRLSDIIRRNTSIGRELPTDVFRVAD